MTRAKKPEYLYVQVRFLPRVLKGEVTLIGKGVVLKTTSNRVKRCVGSNPAFSANNKLHLEGMDNNDKKLESLCEELMKHLRENYSPHTSINIDGGRYELLCGIKSGVSK